MVESVRPRRSAVGVSHCDLIPVNDGDVGLRVGEPVHELTGQAQDLLLGLRELGESEGEPGIALDHVRDEDGAPGGGEFKHLMPPVGLVPIREMSPSSSRSANTRVSDCGRWCAAAASAPAVVGPCRYTWLSTLSLLRLRPSCARSARRRWASRSVPCRTPAAVSLSRWKSIHGTLVRYSLLYWTREAACLVA